MKMKNIVALLLVILALDIIGLLYATGTIDLEQTMDAFTCLP